MTDVLSISGLSKSFGSKLVLDDISIDVRSGTLHALLGANGAGKSTLIKILCGLEKSDSGVVAVRSRQGGPHGRIGAIHQDLGLIDQLSVRENLYLSPSPRQRMLRIVSASAEVRRARAQLAVVNLDVEPSTPLGELSLGEKTMVAISRLFEEEDPDLIILDEVTAALNRSESDWLLGRIREFVGQGGAALVVTHRIHEVATHCDDTTIIRDGVVQFSGATPELGQIHEMLSAGALPEKSRRASPNNDAKTVLTAVKASSPSVGPLSLEVRAGEVVALFGSLSSRLYEVGHLLAGTAEAISGEVHVTRPDGSVGRSSILPEDRLGLGVLTGLTVADNAVVSAMSTSSIWRLVSRRASTEQANTLIDRMNVQPTGCAGMPMLSLSGGNQQKVLLGRVAMTEPDLYIFCEPTRGVDLPTRAAIRSFIGQLATAGAAVVVVTIDIDDALATADRVALVDKGRITSWFDRNEANAEHLLELVS